MVQTKRKPGLSSKARNSEKQPGKISAPPPNFKYHPGTTSQPPPGFSWAVPAELGIPVDPLRLRLDFHHQAVEMTFFEGESTTSKTVAAMDVAHALASELSFGTGLLPADALWWRNTRRGAVVALYVEAHLQQVTLQTAINKPPRRFRIPLPGLVFICRPKVAPWVYAVKSKPKKESDIVYRAPLANIHDNGRSCPGTNKYPARLEDVVDSFFRSFFSETAELGRRSKQFPRNVIHLWEFLDGKKKYPMADMVTHGTIGDLMNMEMD